MATWASLRQENPGSRSSTVNHVFAERLNMGADSRLHIFQNLLEGVSLTDNYAPYVNGQATNPLGCFSTIILIFLIASSHLNSVR